MRQIVKGPEPASLTTHRLTVHADYDNYVEKDDLRTALVSEQRALCCYCMRKISAEPASMKIEHWRSQTNYPEEQLTYQNLLAGCKGGEGLPLEYQHCDTRKGNADIHWNPANPAHHIETRIKYTFDGSIASDDAEFDDQLNNVLNLNLPTLKNNRKSKWDGVLSWWKSEKTRLHRRPSKKRIEKEIERRTQDGANLVPYCQVVVYILREKLAGM